MDSWQAPPCSPRVGLLGVLFALLLMVSGCGARDHADGGDPAAEGTYRVTLSGNLERSMGLVLATGKLVPASQAEHASGDIYLSVRKVVQLRGPTTDAAPLCNQGAGFTSVSAIPADVGACTWGWIEVSGNSSYAESRWAGYGFLVRDRDQSLYRLLMEDDRIETGVARVTFSVSRVTSAAE